MTLSQSGSHDEAQGWLFHDKKGATFLLENYAVDIYCEGTERSNFIGLSAVL